MSGLLAIVGLLLGTVPPAAASATASPGPGGVAWARSYAEASGRAKTQNKLVFVEFDKADCGDCKRLDVLLYPATDFEFLLLRMVPVKLKLGEGEAAPLAARYHVTDAPSVLIVSPGGALVFRLEGFDPPASFYPHVRKSLADWDALNVRMIHEPESIDDPKAELLLGAELYRRFDSEEAIPRLERASRSARADEPTREQALAYLASAQLELHRIEDAKASVAAILRSTKDAFRREKAELFLGQISLAEGKRAEARRQFEEFVKKHPASRLKPEAEAFLKGLDKL